MSETPPATVPLEGENAQTLATAAEALLREHPDALVCGLSSNGLIVPVPQSVGLWGQEAIEGRAVTDVVVAADRATVVQVWGELEERGRGQRQGPAAQQALALGHDPLPRPA